MFTLIILSVVRGVLPLIQIYLYKLIIDSVTAVINTGAVSQSFNTVMWYIFAAGIVYYFNTVFEIYGSVFNQKYVSELTDYIFDIIHRKSVDIDLEYYENPEYRDTLHRAQREAAFRPAQLINFLTQILQSLISLAGVVILLITLHYAIVLVLLIATLPLMYFRFKYSKKIYKWERNHTQQERKANYYNWILTSYAYAKEIRINRLGEYFMPIFRKEKSDLRTDRFKFEIRQSGVEALYTLTGTISVFGSYGFIAYRTINGLLTIGDLVLYFQAFQRGLGFMSGLINGVAGVYKNNLFIVNIFEFLDLQSKIESVTAHKSLVFKGNIIFDNVSFQYPGSDKFALKNVSLNIEKGSVVAFVGENGSGKTTLVKLICRFYDPTIGSVKIDGVDLRNINILDLRRSIGAIFQDYSSYYLTVRENIGFGDASSLNTSDRIERAACKAGADSFIERLPQKYDAILGKWFDNGTELSMGEWQRIALARALLRDAPILLMDEPISSMDILAVERFYTSFFDSVRGKTIILVSHNLSLSLKADIIHYIVKGEIAESGSHKELIAKNGAYAKMFNIFAKYYQNTIQSA